MRKESVQFQNGTIMVYIDEKNNFWFYHRDVTEKFGLKNWKSIYIYIKQNFYEEEKRIVNSNDFEEEYYGPRKLIISITGILHLAYKYKIKDNKFLDWIKEMKINDKNMITKNEDEEEHLLMKVDENEITKEEPNVEENNDTINNNKDDDDQFKKLCDEVFKPIMAKYKEKEEENTKLKNILKHIKDMIEEIL